MRKKKLSLELRRELLTRTVEDYASVRKGIKSQIVDQLVAATGYGRKYAITLLNNPPSGVSWGSDSNGAKSHANVVSRTP